jgi:SAM-dependent methyltransferase
MWNERYAEPGFVYGTDPNDLLVLEVGRLPPGGRVLCLAEGEGRNAAFLLRQGFVVTGVDASSVGLAKAAALAASQGHRLETVVADLSTFDLGEAAWEGVVSIWCHLPQPLRKKVHASVVRALKPGGVLILEAYTPRQLAYGTGGPPSAAMLFEPAEIADELAGLELLRCEERTRMVHEGRYHDGQSAVLQVVAQKPA